MDVRFERVAVEETFALRQRVLRPRLTVRDVETAEDREADTAHVIARLRTDEVVGRCCIGGARRSAVVDRS